MATLSFFGLGVHPEFRRRGIAAALIREVERIAAEKGCAGVVMHTVRQTGNVAVFERLGYSIESEAPTDLFESVAGLPLSEVVMRKSVCAQV